MRSPKDLTVRWANLPFLFRKIEYENPRNVTMVFEDRANPVIGKVQSLVENRGIPFSSSSGNFGDDLTILLAARTLVTGHGLLPKRLFCCLQVCRGGFRSARTRISRSKVALSTRLLESLILRGATLAKFLSGNWKNSPEQRQLMMEYPAESLGIRELGPSPRKRRP